MVKFEAYNSRWRLALILLGCLGFAVLGMWFVGAFGELPSFSERPRRQRIPPELLAIVTPIIGWFSIIFFGFCAASITKRLFDQGPSLSITDSGIAMQRWSPQTIPWNEIADVSSWNMAGQKTIVLHLKNPDRFPGRGLLGLLAGANRSLTRGDIAISLNGTDRSFDEALAAIMRFRNAVR